eukprot:tig00000145_g8833.t1
MRRCNPHAQSAGPPIAAPIAHDGRSPPAHVRYAAQIPLASSSAAAASSPLSASAAPAGPGRGGGKSAAALGLGIPQFLLRSPCPSSRAAVPRPCGRPGRRGASRAGARGAAGAALRSTGPAACARPAARLPAAESLAAGRGVGPRARRAAPPRGPRAARVSYLLPGYPPPAAACGLPPLLAEKEGGEPGKGPARRRSGLLGPGPSGPPPRPGGPPPPFPYPPAAAPTEDAPDARPELALPRLATFELESRTSFPGVPSRVTSPVPQGTGQPAFSRGNAEGLRGPPVRVRPRPRPRSSGGRTEGAFSLSALELAPAVRLQHSYPGPSPRHRRGPRLT